MHYYPELYQKNNTAKITCQIKNERPAWSARQLRAVETFAPQAMAAVVLSSMPINIAKHGMINIKRLTMKIASYCQWNQITSCMGWLISLKMLKITQPKILTRNSPWMILAKIIRFFLAIIGLYMTSPPKKVVNEQRINLIYNK
ncbi:MAG: hypothetical protein WCV69_04910 [Patescibacteria group bacterium]|jgi:hypothetical protein